MSDAPPDQLPDPSADRMAERYGRPSRGRRTAVVLGSGLVGVLALTWLAWAIGFHATPDVTSELVGWEVVDDHAVTAHVDVSLQGDAQDVVASCEVQAVAADHTVVGEASFVPTEGSNVVSVRTERRATSVDWIGCTTPDQHRPR